MILRNIKTQNEVNKLICKTTTSKKASRAPFDKVKIKPRKVTSLKNIGDFLIRRIKKETDKYPASEFG